MAAAARRAALRLVAVSDNSHSRVDPLEYPAVDVARCRVARVAACEVHWAALLSPRRSYAYRAACTISGPATRILAAVPIAARMPYGRQRCGEPMCASVHACMCVQGQLVRRLGRGAVLPVGAEELRSAEDGVVAALPRLVSGPPRDVAEDDDEAQAEHDDPDRLLVLQNGLQPPLAWPPREDVALLPAPQPVRVWREATGNVLGVPQWVRHDLSVNVVREVRASYVPERVSQQAGLVRVRAHDAGHM